MPGSRLFVTVEGYAVEGGFDEPASLMSCYSPVVALQRVAGPGPGDDLWRRYEEVLALVPSLGVEGVRLTLEWARIEPRPGEVDGAALERYRAVLDFARAQGLAVTVALVDAVWPSWLGQEAWLLPWVAPRVLTHARRVASEFDGLIGGVVPFTQGDRFAKRGYLDATAPPWRKGARDDARSVESHLSAIQQSLANDDLVGPKIVTSYTSVFVDDGADAIVAARERDVSEVYVRSLLRGRGPTAVGEGLLAHHDDTWRVQASEELLEALR